MDRPRYSQDQITDLLREAELRLAQGKPLASVCKSLGISRSSYRQWRREYGERAAENAAAVASGNAGRAAGADPASSEGVLAKEAKASTNEVPALSGEAKELLHAANDASGPAKNAWLAFLGLLAYLLITLGGVSHKDLLLNSPVKLPIINVDIPLFSFFQYAPLLLLLVYLALLIQHVMLAGKFRSFTEAIEPYEKKTGEKHPARQLVYPYVIAQILAGPKQSLLVRGLMRLMVFVTFALLPVVTLLYFQITFLPYHAVRITYWHRVLVVVGLVLLFAIMPIIHLRPRKGEISIGPPGVAWQKSPLGIFTGLVLALLVLGFSWFVATVPDEGMDRLVGFDAPKRQNVRGALLNPLVRVAYDWIPDAENPDDRGWLLSPLVSFRVLVVEDTDLVADEGDKSGEVSRVLRGRDLRFARLNRSDLHRADLTKADLRSAELARTRLENAKLQETKLQGADLSWAKLQNADLSNAELQGADLTLVNLQGAHLSDAELQGAHLSGAELQGANLHSAKLQNAADLSGAKLQGADLSYAELQGANLWSANLQGAHLGSAQLQGANLDLAKLQGADLRSANLLGADLHSAKLQGANLKSAQLEGAELWSANLQGAHLKYAQLQGADLSDAELQGADFGPIPSADVGRTRVWLATFPADFAQQSPAPLGLALAEGLAELNMSPLETSDKLALSQEISAIPDGNLRAKLIYRLEPILQGDLPEWKEKAQLSLYVSQARDPSFEDLVPFLAKLACGEPDGYVARSMAQRAEDYGWYETRHQYAKPLARWLLDENCEGAKALTDETRAKLRELVAATE